MSNLHDFLVEHAKFPFPQLKEGPSSASITDISLIEVPLLEREWKANHAVFYCGFRLGYSSLRVAEKTAIGEGIQAKAT